MRIYFDNCSLQRPLDNKIQIRIAVEAEAIVGLLALCELGRVELISSEALVFEVRQNPNHLRQRYALRVLSKAGVYTQINDRVENRAKALVERGLSPLDALHLASAEEADADYLCTCDDGFLRRAKSMSDLRTRMVSPLELIEEIEQRC